MTESIPTPPAWLTAEALEHWNRVAPQALANKTLDPNHYYAFGVMCESLADMVFLQRVIREEGLTIGGEDGKATKAHPSLRQLESCRAHCLKMLESFGLTARSRKNVKEARPDLRDNPFANLDDPGDKPRRRSVRELMRKA